MKTKRAASRNNHSHHSSEASLRVAEPKAAETVPKLRSPQDLLQAVPYLLGYAPADCLVAVVVRDGYHHVTLGAPLEVVEQPDGPPWVLSRLILDRDGHPNMDFRVFLVGYGDRERVLAALRLMRPVLSQQIVDCLIVDRGRWWFADKDKLSPGRPLPPTDQLPGGMVRSRVTALSREDLAASLAAPTGEDEDAMVQALIEALDQVPEDPIPASRLVLDTIAAWRRGDALSDTEFVAAGVAMAAGVVREEIWRWLTRDRAIECLPFWKQVLRRTAYGARPIVLAVTGFHAWLAGEGAVLNICCEEAHASGSQNSLVLLVDKLAQSALPPTCWEEVLDHLASRVTEAEASPEMGLVESQEVHMVPV